MEDVVATSSLATRLSPSSKVWEGSLVVDGEEVQLVGTITGPVEGMIMVMTFRLFDSIVTSGETREGRLEN